LTSTHADGPDAGASAHLPAEPARLAPAGRRIVSCTVDLTLLLVALGFVLLTELAFASEGQQDVFTGAWIFGFAPLFFALYHAFGTGATPGQLELRIGLRDARTGRLPGLARTLVRAYLGFAFLVLVVPALVDFLMLLGGRSLRDRMTRTLVVPIALEGKAPELAGVTIPELAAIFEPPAGTRRYLRRGWALLWARPRLVLGTVAALYAVLGTVAVVLGFLVVADSPDEWTIESFAFLAGALMVSGVYWTQAAVVVGVEDVRVGGLDASVWATLVRASRRVNALTAALLILLVFMPLAWLVVPLLLVGRLSLIAPALVLEDSRVFGSFRRSWQLTEGSTMRLLGLVVLSGLVLWGAGIAVSFPAQIASAANEAAGLVLGAVLGAVGFVVALAWLGASWALVYEDARRSRTGAAGAGV
jgi:hypothetical protein